MDGNATRAGISGETKRKPDHYIIEMTLLSLLCKRKGAVDNWTNVTRGVAACTLKSGQAMLLSES